MKEAVLEAISGASLKKILDIDDFEETEWIWVNKGIYKDIMFNLQMDHVYDEVQIEEFIDGVLDREMLDKLIKPFRSQGYLPMNQFQFAMAEKGFKPTKEIETVVFVKEKLYRKLMIRLMKDFSWILKAMALDTYFKMGSQYRSLMETYRELYEENGRIIDAVLSNEEHRYLTGRWKFERKTKELLFFKQDELYHSWGEGEAEARFQESVRR